MPSHARRVVPVPVRGWFRFPVPVLTARAHGPQPSGSSRLAKILRRGITAALAVVVVGNLAGCVERKLVFRSRPEGALLTVEDLPAPTPTPVEIPAVWDGVRRVELTAPGYRVLESTADVKARWFDYFPLDVFAEFMWPGTITDVQVFDYELEAWYPLSKKLTLEHHRELAERVTAVRARADAYRSSEADGAPAESGEAPATAPDEPPPPPPPPARSAPAPTPGDEPPVPLPPAPRGR